MEIKDPTKKEKLSHPDTSCGHFLPALEEDDITLPQSTWTDEFPDTLHRKEALEFEGEGPAGNYLGVEGIYPMQGFENQERCYRSTTDPPENESDDDLDSARPEDYETPDEFPASEKSDNLNTPEPQDNRTPADSPKSGSEGNETEESSDFYADDEDDQPPGDSSETEQYPETLSGLEPLLGSEELTAIPLALADAHQDAR